MSVNHLKEVAQKIRATLDLPHTVAAHANRDMRRFLRRTGRMSGADGHTNEIKTNRRIGKKVIK